MKGRAPSRASAAASEPPAPAGRVATSWDVAQAAGVSRATVSRCFTDGALVRDSTRARILAAAKTLGYEPNLLARMLNKQESNIVAVLTADFANPFQPTLMESLSDALRAEGLSPLLLKARSIDEPADALMQLALSYRVSAIIVTVLSASPLVVRRCVDSGSPVIFLNRVPEDAAAISVCLDPAAGAARAAEVLVEGGASRIAIVSGRIGNWANSVRRGAFRQRLDALGLDAVATEPGDFTYEGGKRAAAAILKGAPRVDAIYACNDAMAFGALDVIRGAGGRVPDDIAVVGFDDVPIAAWDAYRLSTVRQPVDVLVRHVCEILRRPEGPLGLIGRSFLHGGDFVHRATTHPVALRPGEIEECSGEAAPFPRARAGLRAKAARR